MYAVGKFYNTNSLTHKIIIMMHVARLMGYLLSWAHNLLVAIGIWIFYDGKLLRAKILHPINNPYDLTKQAHSLPPYFSVFSP